LVNRADGGGNTKSQSPNPKEAAIPKHQTTVRAFWRLELGISLELGAWNLGF
jgi:hypothetical protein